MLLTALLAIVVTLAKAGLALFPTWRPPTNSPGWTALSAANIVLPLDTWSMLMGLTLGAMLAGLVVWVVKLVLNLIRGSGA